MQFNQIKEILFKKYYHDENFSEVTSSHWRDFGAKTIVTRINQEFDINAYGISNFYNKSFSLSLKNIALVFLLSGLMKEHNAKEKTISCAKSITKQLNVLFSFDHAKHVIIYDFLDSYSLFKTQKIICIIGDGHGFLGTLIKAMCPDIKILFINLGRNLLIDIECFSRIFPDITPLYFRKPEDHKQIPKHSIIFLEAENYDYMKNLPISLFINIASMQEMDMPVIKSYFEYMGTSTENPYFYCVNREEKKLPDGSTIRFCDYPWGGADVIIDGPCPWYQKYPIWRPPFWYPFDGTIMHRLVNFSTTL